MTLQRLTYAQKTNPKPVIDRTKQATAEDFNEIKDVVNPLVDIVQGVEANSSRKSFANVAAATAEWNAANPKPEDGIMINIEDVNQTFKWASGEASKVLFVKDNIDGSSVVNAQNTADAAQSTANNAMQNAANAQLEAQGANDTADEAQNAADGAQSTADNALSKANTNEQNINQNNNIIGDREDIDEFEGSISQGLLVNKETSERADNRSDFNQSVLSDGVDSFEHAKRIKEDGGTTVDLIPLDQELRIHRNSSFVLLPHSGKASKIYAQNPVNGDGDLVFYRPSICDTIDKNGNSTPVALNEPRLDYQKKYEDPTDESYYELDGVNKNKIAISPAISFANGEEWSVSLLADLDANQEVSFSPFGHESVTGTFWYTSAGSRFRFRSSGNQYTNDGTYDVTAGVLGQGKKLVTFVNNNANILVYVDDTLVDTLDLPSDTSIIFNTIGTGYGSGSNTKGKIYGFWIDNRALSGGEVADRFNGVELIDSVKGATPNNFYPNDSSTFVDGTYSWAAYGNNTIANVSNTLEITYVDNSQGAYNYLRASSDLNRDLIVGKKYRVEFEAKYNGGATAPRMRVAGVSEGTLFTNNLTNNMVKYIVVFEASSPTSCFLAASNMVTGNVITLDNIKIYEIGNVLELTKAKVNSGLDVIQNGSFDTDSIWQKGVGWSISGGVAISTGDQTGTSLLTQANILEIGHTYKTTFEIKSISSGTIRVHTGSNSPYFNTVGVKTFYGYNAASLSLFIEASSDFIGTIDNVSVQKTSVWYDLNHAIKGIAHSSLFASVFSKIKHQLHSSPSLLLEPAATRYFLNSRAPVTQTITGLTVGQIYTVNCKGLGVISIEETGGNGVAGTATETHHFTYKAAQTSVTITLVDGHSFEWVQVTNTMIPLRHAETLGTTLSVLRDDYNLYDIQQNNIVGATSGTFVIDVRNTLSGISNDFKIQMNGNFPWYISTRLVDNKLIWYNPKNGYFSSLLAENKIGFTWDGDIAYVSADGVGEYYKITPFVFEHLRCYGSTTSTLEVNKIIMKNHAISSEELNKLTTT